MHAATSATLLNEVCELMGWDFDRLTQRQWTSLRAAYGAGLKRVWEAAWWPELMQTPRLSLRNAWVDRAALGSTYPAGSEVYFSRSRGYYMALVETAAVPATRVPLTDEWVASAGYWRQMAGSYEGTDWDPDTASQPLGVYLYDGRYWVMRGVVAVTSAPDEDALNWIELPLLDPLLSRTGTNRAPLGRIRTITLTDPAKALDAQELQFVQCPEGWRMPDWEATESPELYVEHRQMTPAINGDSYDASATYTRDPIAGPGLVPESPSGAGTVATVQQNTIPSLRVFLPYAVVGSIVDVLGHTTVGDEGGGLFRCVQIEYAGTALYDDNGSVIFEDIESRYTWGPQKAFVRLPGPLPRCEWFGGKRDAVAVVNTDGVTGYVGVTDNMFAINECLRVYGVCHLLEGLYGVDWCRTRLPSGQTAGILDSFPRNYLDFRPGISGVAKKLIGPGRGRGGLCYLNRPRSLPGTPATEFIRGTGQPSPEPRSGYVELTGGNRSFASTANFTCRAALCYMPGVGGHTNYHCDNAEVRDVDLHLNSANRWLLNRSPIDSVVNGVPTSGSRRIHTGFVQMAPQAIWLQGSEIQIDNVRVTGWSHGTQNIYEQVIVMVSTSRGLDNPVIRKIKGPRITRVLIDEEHLSDYRKASAIAGLTDGFLYVARSGVYALTADPAVFNYTSYLIPPQFWSFPEINGIVVGSPGGTQDADTKYIYGTHIEGCEINGMSMIYSRPDQYDEVYWLLASDVLQSPHFKHGMTIYGGYGSTVINNVFRLIDGAAYYEDSSAPNGSLVFSGNVIDRCSSGVALFGVLYAQNVMSDAVFSHNTFLIDGDPTALLYPSLTTGRGYTETLAFQLWCYGVNFPFFQRIAFVGNVVKYQNLIALNNYGCRVAVQYQDQIDQLVLSRNTIMVDDEVHEDFGCRTRNGIVFVAPATGTTYPGKTQLTDNYTHRGNVLVPAVTANITRATTISCASEVWSGTGITATLVWDAVEFWLKVTHPAYAVDQRRLDWGSVTAAIPAGQGSFPLLRLDLCTQTETYIQFRSVTTETLIEQPEDDMDFRLVYLSEWGFQVSQQLSGLALVGDYPELDISAVAVEDLAGLEPGIDYYLDRVNYRFLPYETVAGLQPSDITGAGRLVHYDTPAIKAMVKYNGATWDVVGNCEGAAFVDSKMVIEHLPVLANSVRNLTSNDELTARILFDECTTTQTVIQWYQLEELQTVASTAMNVTVLIL